MCTDAVRKEANRFNWMIKGQLIDSSETDATVEKLYDSYFKRLWGNHEACYREEGFEAAWEERFEQDREKVACLGYN